MLIIDADTGCASQFTKCDSDKKLAGLHSVVVTQGAGAYCVIPFCISHRIWGWVGVLGCPKCQAERGCVKLENVVLGMEIESSDKIHPS